MSTEAVSPSISTPHVFTVANKPLTVGKPGGFKSTIPNHLAVVAVANFDFPATLAGSTAHFRVYYNPNLGPAGLTLAQGVLGKVEADYNTVSAMFGGIHAGPFNVIISGGINGAYHYGCSATDLYCDSGSVDWTSFLVVAEEVEVFEAVQNRGWNCGASNGEGVSRVVAQALYPAQDPESASAAAWLNGGRPDFITKNDNSDTNPVSFGCANLFLNYLRVQLGFSYAQIMQAAAATLEGVYENLTRSVDSLGQFRADLELRFPSNQQANPANDNPFPVPVAIRKNTLVETSIQSISGGDLNGLAHVAWCGTDPQHHLNVMASNHRYVWRNKVTLGDTSTTGVSMCAFNGRLYIAWGGVGNLQLNVMSSADGVNWGNKVTLGDTSSARPMLAVHNGQLVLAWTGIDPQHHINLLFSADGVHFGNKHTIVETAIGSPAVASFLGRLYVAWAGTDPQHHLNVDFTTDGGATTQGKVTLQETSNNGPGLLAFGSELMLTWTGTDSRLNLLRSINGAAWINKLTLGETTHVATSLAMCYGQPAYLWTGTDSHLNLQSV